MRVHPIVFAVPLYAVLIGVEMWLTRRRGPDAYDVPELLTNIASGLGQLVTDIFFGLLYVVPYGFLLRHSVHSFSSRDPLAWLIGFIGVDFAFYWQHRFSHRVNLLWAAHVVHHQPQRYNLSVALRQPWFSVLSNWIYYQPLALLGVPADVFVGCVALNLLYQFYLHTSLIQRMRAVEFILNTPSHHRVHHGRNEHYLDRNYGGVFIIWDRLFGTFQAEDKRVEFGTTVPFSSLNGVWANFEYLAVLWGRSRRQGTLKSALYVWFAPPEWRSAAEESASPSSRARPCEPTKATLVYAASSTFVAVVAAAVLLDVQSSITHWQRLLGVLFVVWTLATAGGMLDGRRWAKRAEPFRLATFAVSAVWLWLTARHS